MTFEDYLKEGFQFAIKNTNSGNWFCDVSRLVWDNHQGVWYDIYVENDPIRFLNTMTAALEHSIDLLNEEGFMEIKR